MFNEIEIAIRGWVGQRPRIVETQGSAGMVSVRVGSTPRRRDKSGNWGDGETAWFSVIAFGDLAENATRSLRKGDPVLVRGRLNVRRSERDGREFLTNEIVADAIGIELSHGTALYAPTVRRDRDASPEREGPRHEAADEFSTLADDVPDVEPADYLESEDLVPTA